MSRLGAVLATLACMIGLTVAPAPPAAADTITVGEPSWSVALTFPDMQWLSGSCQHLPVSAVVTGSGVESWTFGGFVTPREDDGDYDGGSAWYIDYDTKVTAGTGTFTFRHAVVLCPGYDAAGLYDVVGEVGVMLTGAAGWSWVPYRATFTVSGIPTTTVLDSITVAGPQAMFSGRTTAAPSSPETFRGCSDRWLRIERMVGTEWEEVGGGDVSPDGTFVATIPTYRLVEAQYRATFFGGSLCATSSSQARPLPVRLPTVALSTVSRDSKVKVDIDPNMGRKYWVFQLQRQVGDEEWRTVRTYRTRGARETRTINQRQGMYRVRVLARFGFAETYSDSIYLQR